MGSTDAVVDRSGADFQLFGRGATEGRRLQVTGPDDEIERNRPGGSSQMRYQHRAEDCWEHNAAAVAVGLGTALREVDGHVLMLAGDVRARQYLAKHLPVWLRRDVSIHPVSGGRSQDGAWAERAQQVETETCRAGRAETDALFQDFVDQRPPHGHAVEGAYATLRALTEGRLRVLLISEDPGTRHAAWFGAGAADVADRRTGLHADAKPHVRGPLIRRPLRPDPPRPSDNCRLIRNPTHGPTRNGLLGRRLARGRAR